MVSLINIVHLITYGQFKFLQCGKKGPQMRVAVNGQGIETKDIKKKQKQTNKQATCDRSEADSR